MPEIIVLRTHYYDAFVDRMLRTLQATAGRRIVAVVDERNGLVTLPAGITRIPLDPKSRGLYVTQDAGWRCGDYALYEALRAIPEATAYWLIEPDVRIHANDIAAFFDGAESTVTADFLTAWFVRAAAPWQWYRTMAPFANNIHATMMQLCRISRRAALHLVRERRALGERFRTESRSPGDWPNDEAFVATTLANAGFRVATFREHAPAFKTEGSFTFTRPTSERWLETLPPDDRIYHPVVRGQKFRDRVNAYLQEGAQPKPIDPLLQKQLDIESTPDNAPKPVQSVPPIRPASLPAAPHADLIAPIPAAPSGSPLPIRFWNRIRNNGDALTSILATQLFGAAPYQAPQNQPHLLGVGSILFMANRHSILWGCGVLNKIAYLPPIGPHQVRALRGKHSADYMIEKGIALGNVVFGDPGILVDRLLPQELKAAPAKYRYAVVPHHNSTNHPLYAGLHGRDDICLVNILDDSLLPIQQIAQSEVVISQSLHGLIYAESLGKPSIWISPRSDEVWNYKFNDWFTTTANPQPAPAPFEHGLERLAAAAELRRCTIDRQALIDCFPSNLLQQTTAAKLDYATCRALEHTLFFVPKSYDPQPDFISNRDGPALAALSPTLASFTNALFANWAERTYSIAVQTGTALIPTPPQSRAIIAALDARSSVDFGMLIKKPASLPDGARAVQLDAGVTLYANYKALGPVLYLRPSFEALSENFIVFGI